MRQENSIGYASSFPQTKAQVKQVEVESPTKGARKKKGGEEEQEVWKW